MTFRIERRLRSGRYSTFAGKLSDEGQQGVNVVAYDGRLRGRALAPGHHRLRAVATGKTGGASAPKPIRFASSAAELAFIAVSGFAR